MAALLTAGSVAATAGAAIAAPAPAQVPVAADGAKVESLAGGLGVPAEFAFGAGQVFVAGAPARRRVYSPPLPGRPGPPNMGVKRRFPGGVFVLRGPLAVRLPYSPRRAYGLAWRRGRLYIAAGRRLLEWRGFDGHRFKRRKTIFRGSRRFPGFNGIAFGPNGRLYAGVTLAKGDDHRRSRRPYAQTVLSLRPDGSDVRVVARHLRQPWMPAFLGQRRHPFFTVLGQDNLGPHQPPDYLIVARKGQDYGFPRCNWSRPRRCRGFTKPRRLLPPHSSPVGIGAIGRDLYVALLGGTGSGSEVVRLRASGRGPLHPYLTGFPAPVVALGTHRGWLYAGDQTGVVYRVRPLSARGSRRRARR